MGEMGKGEMGTAHAGKPPSLPRELRTPLVCFSLCVALALKFNGTVILRRNLYWAYCVTSESSRTWINPRVDDVRVEVSAWGDFPNACADLVTLLHWRHFVVQLAIGVKGDVRWIQQLPGMGGGILIWRFLSDVMNWCRCLTLKNSYQGDTVSNPWGGRVQDTNW
jgi:hypothetical protein